MTGIRLADLPPKLRAQVEGQVAKPKRAVKGTGDSVFRGRCQCGEVFDGSRGRCNWEAHSDSTGHRRFEADIAPRSVP